MENNLKPFLIRLFDKPLAGTPGSPCYDVLERSTRLLLPFLVRTRFETGGFTLPEGPALFVSNHPTPVDYMQIACLLWPRRIVPIANEYYMRRGLSKKLLSSAGIIPKKMFANDISMIRKALRTVQGGWSLYLAPEGRLSADGEPYPIHPSSGGFARLLKVPLVILHFSGAYYNKPKWRRDFRRQTVRIEVKDIIPPEELKKMTSREVNARIRAGIAADEAARTYEKSLVWPKGGKALGLQNLIYRCPACGALYAMETAGNELSCHSCSMTLRFDEHYRLEENPAGWEDVADLYRVLTEWERKERPSLSCAVTVRRFRGEAEDKGKGETRLTPEGFSFSGTVGKEKIQFFLSPEQLKALPFSCGQEFETYYQGDLYYFYPDTQREQCARWGLLADLYCEAYFEEK
ncbi:MAG: 1-acyl-sn-glycerol-3-phosphate acyltransferase [Lachnospiraceae bacterium]|nr:1-acyl-sn-glycerol-3-phosphate acyltransferase [Lachnospiraceae bacterium]